MKLLVPLLTLSLFSTGLAVAQTSRPSVKPPATRPAATDTSSGSSSASSPAGSANPNRLQELYDQHHGVTRKPTPPAPVAAPATSEASPRQRPAAAEPATPASPAEPAAPSATEASSSSVRIGIRGGVNYPLYTEEDPLADPVVGFVGGLVLNFGTGLLSFQPEINYARTSRKVVGSLNSSIDQIQVPLFLKIASGTYEGTRFFLNVGPYGSYISSASLAGKKISLDGNDGRLSYGVAAGVGAALKAGPGHATIEVRGYYQLGDNAKPSNGTTSIIPVQATLGYSFPLGGR